MYNLRRGGNVLKHLNTKDLSFVIRLGFEPKTPTLKVFRYKVCITLYTSYLYKFYLFIGYS